MFIERTSSYSGITRILDLPVTRKQLDSHVEGMHAQKAFPNLTPAQREFIISGITEKEWNEIFPPENEE